MRKKEKYFSLHYSFVLLLLASVLLGFFKVMFLYFVCLLLHEFVHSLVARKLGYKIGKITLIATGVTLEAESDEFTFNEEILIAISAPLFNFSLSLLLVVFWWLIPETYNFTLDLFVINLSIFAFNMLPIFPLDGGRVLLAILSKKKERQVAVMITKTVTIVFACLLFVVFIVSLFFVPNFNFGVMAVTLFLGAITEDKSAVYKRNFYLLRKYERAKKRGVEEKKIYVSEDIKPYNLLRLIDARFYVVFILVDKNMKEVGIIKERDLVESFTNNANFSLREKTKNSI